MTAARRLLVALTAVAVVVSAAIGLWQAGQEQPRTLEQRTEAVASGLGCPTCEAQSVATSRSEIASAMRAEITAQLATGRTPEEIRAWFVDRYGPVVLLEPPAIGVGLVVWLVPAVLLGAGLVVIAVVIRRRVPAAASPPIRAPRVRRAAPVMVFALVAACGTAWFAGSTGTPAPVAPGTEPPDAAAVPGDEQADPEAWLARGAALEADGEYAASAAAYRRAAELRPQDVRAQVRLGLALLKADQPADAESAARRILAEQPAHPEGLLVLGLAQRARGGAEAAGTLRRFLTAAPDHPAAAEVRRLLGNT